MSRSDLRIESQIEQVQAMTAPIMESGELNDFWLHGPSGAGKSVLASLFMKALAKLLEAKEGRPKATSFQISWAALDPQNLQRSLLFRARAAVADRSYRNWTDLNKELIENNLILVIIIDDTELAFYEQEYLNAIDREVAICQRFAVRSIFFIFTSQFDIDDHLPKSREKIVRWRVEPPTAKQCADLLEDFECHKLAAFVGARPAPPEARILDAMALSLIAALLSSEGDHGLVRAELSEDILASLKSSIVNARTSGTAHESEEQVLIRAKTAFRKFLFECAFRRLQQPDLIPRLLCWATVDPAFDYFVADDDFKLSRDFADVQGLFDFFFSEANLKETATFAVRQGPRLRLGHRSVLDLYRDASVLKPEVARARHSEQAKELARRAHEARELVWSMKLAALRHEIRSSDTRTVEQLSRLKELGTSAESAASHELAFAWADFAAGFESLRVYSDMLTKLKTPNADSNESTAYFELGEWYQLPKHIGDSKALTDPLLIDWTALNLAEVCYQSLDQWGLAHEILRKSRASEDENGDPALRESLNILRSLFAGAMVVVTSDYLNDPAAALEYSDRQRLVLPKTAWDWNWEANELICRTDMGWLPFIDRANPDQPGFEAELGRTVERLESCIRSMQAVQSGESSLIDQVRIGVCQSRAVFASRGWKAALETQEQSLALIPEDGFRQTQEKLYGAVAAAYYALCGLERKRFLANLENVSQALDDSGDEWISRQHSYLKFWGELMAAYFLEEKMPKEDTLLEIARSFMEIDGYSATFSLHTYAQLCGEPIDREKLTFLNKIRDPEGLQKLRSFVQGDPFTQVALELTEKNARPTSLASHLDQIWFADGWRDLWKVHGRHIRPLMSGVQVFRMLPPAFTLEDLPAFRSSNQSETNSKP